MVLEDWNLSEVIKCAENICLERKFPVYSLLSGPVRVWWDYVFSCLIFRTFWTILSHPGLEPRWPEIQMLLFPVKVQKSISSSDHKTGTALFLDTVTCCLQPDPKPSSIIRLHSLLTSVDISESQLSMPISVLWLRICRLNACA